MCGCLASMKIVTFRLRVIDRIRVDVRGSGKRDL